MTEAKELQAAFKKKESTQSLLAGLKKLRTNGSVTVDRYEYLKHGYQQKMVAAVSEIASIKSRLSVKLQAAKQNINFHKTDLEQIRTEYNSGNLSIRKYQAQERKLTGQLDDLRAKIYIMQKLVEAKSADNADIRYVKKGLRSGSKRRLPVWALAATIIVPLLVIGSVTAVLLGGQFSSLFNPDQSSLDNSPKGPSVPKTSSSSLSDIIEGAVPSVVLIICRYGYDSYGSGSGVVVDRRGYILTNNHVIEGAQDILVFLLKDEEVKVAVGYEYEAEVVKTNRKSDLAVIKISPDNLYLSEIYLSNSDTLKLGDEVIAIGYPLFEVVYDKRSKSIGSPTVTKGIVSSIRTIDGIKYIQTDTPLNPGNSGGALINVAGEVVGIPTMIVERIGDDQTAQNINFAVAINEARSFVRDAVK